MLTLQMQMTIYVNEYICDNFNLDDVTKQVLNKILLEDFGITTTR